MKIYDKVKWHYPSGKHCPDLKTALIHFNVIIKWLEAKNLLSNEGKEIVANGIDSDFSLNSAMLTDKGNKILDECYNEWLLAIGYSDKISTYVLDNCFKKLK